MTNMIPAGSYVDADYTRGTVTSRSRAGIFFFLAYTPISSQTQQQCGVWHYQQGRAPAAQKSVWLIQELGFQYTILVDIYEDNGTYLDYSRNCTNHQRTQHINVRYYFIHDLIQARAMQLLPIPSAETTANIFPKPSSKCVFQYLRAKFMQVR